LLTELNYFSVVLVTALEIADIDTPNCRAVSAKGIPKRLGVKSLFLTNETGHSFTLYLKEE
jgi:hypothetical protein